MPKTIYTERDIEDLARRGTKEIAVTDEVYLTDIARERAEKLGIALRAPATASSVSQPPSLPAAPRENVDAVVNKVKSDVIARLGPGVDPVMIERIVRRVVTQLK